MNDEKNEVISIEKKINHNLESLNRNLALRRSFWHGLIFALGSSVGFALAITIITYILRIFSFIPGTQGVVGGIINIINGSTK